MPQNTKDLSDSISRLQRPIALIPGVRKCGTTALYACLRQHEGIAASRMKEPQFLGLHPEVVEEHLDWYADLFSDGDDKTLLDGSTMCFGSANACGNIERWLPHARLIIMLRDPAKRTFSGYLHQYKQVKTAELRIFEEILSSLEKKSGDQPLIEAENELLAEAIAQGKVNSQFYTEAFHKRRHGAPFPSRFHDPLYVYKYFQESQYTTNLAQYEETMGDRLMVLFFEELIKSPAVVLQRVFDFLELEAQPYHLNMPRENETILPRNRFARALLQLRRNPVADLVAYCLKGIGLQSAGARLRERYLKAPKPRFEQTHYDRTRALLAPEYDYWLNRKPELESLWRFK